MKKSIISSLIASTLLLVGGLAPTIAQANTTTTGDINSNNTGIVTTNKMSYLFALNNSSFRLVTDRGLGANTPWFYDKTVQGADGFTYYRVATNEWVGSNYLGNVEVKTTTTDATGNNTVDPTVPTGQRIIGNSESKIYHMPSQRIYKIKASNVIYFDTEQDAINAGYTKSER